MNTKLLLLVGLVLISMPSIVHSRDQAKENAATTQPVTQGALGLRYQLSGGSDKWDAEKKQRIVEAMDSAVAIYNANGSFDKTVTANWSPGTPTADANYDGWINFGGQIGARTALHEIGHTFGIGTHPKWRSLMKDGKWTGEHAIALLREFDGPEAILHCDRQHFWPYGLNFDKEDGQQQRIRHVKMVAAFVKDLDAAESKK